MIWRAKRDKITGNRHPASLRSAGEKLKKAGSRKYKADRLILAGMGWVIGMTERK